MSGPNVGALLFLDKLNVDFFNKFYLQFSSRLGKQQMTIEHRSDTEGLVGAQRPDTD